MLRRLSMNLTFMTIVVLTGSQDRRELTSKRASDSRCVVCCYFSHANYDV